MRMSFFLWKRQAFEILSGTCYNPASENNLISEGKDDIDQEQDTVHDGQRSLSNTSGFAVVCEDAMELAQGCIVPVLEDENSRCNEHSATNQGEEEICGKVSLLIVSIKIFKPQSYRVSCWWVCSSCSQRKGRSKWPRIQRKFHWSTSLCERCLLHWRNCNASPNMSMWWPEEKEKNKIEAWKKKLFGLI